MPTFALNKIEGTGDKRLIYKLSRDGKCWFDEFLEKTYKSGNLENDADKLLFFIEEYSHSREIPHNTIKPLVGRKSNDKVLDYEFRTNKLRVYFFVDSEGAIIVLGGKNDKKEKDRNVASMRRIKSEYQKQKK